MVEAAELKLGLTMPTVIRAPANLKRPVKTTLTISTPFWMFGLAWLTPLAIHFIRRTFFPHKPRSGQPSFNPAETAIP